MKNDSNGHNQPPKVNVQAPKPAATAAFGLEAPENMGDRAYSTFGWNTGVVKMQANANIEMHDIKLDFEKEKLKRKRRKEKEFIKNKDGTVNPDVFKSEIKREEEEEGFGMEKRVYSVFDVNLANKNNQKKIKQQYKIEDDKDALLKIEKEKNAITINQGTTMKTEQQHLATGDTPTSGEKSWHSYSNIEVLKELVTSSEGLSIEEHLIRLKLHGPNLITPVESRHWFVKFLINLVGGFQLFLWAGFILCVVVYCITNFTDYQTLTLGLLCVIVVVGTACFTSYQEGKSDSVMEALRALTPSEVFAYRGGKLEKVLAETLVPGDIVNIKAGEKVPADVRILQSADLKVNNASLTGENVDIKLSFEPKSDTLYEAKNIARMGCNFTNGSGLAVVFATGDHTFFGEIAKSTVQIERPESCLTHEIHRFIYSKKYKLKFSNGWYCNYNRNYIFNFGTSIRILYC